MQTNIIRIFFAIYDDQLDILRVRVIFENHHKKYSLNYLDKVKYYRLNLSKEMKKLMKKTRSHKNIFYLMNVLFCSHIGFIGAIYVICFYNLGLDKLTTNMLSAVFAITVFITEIPTGAFADIFGNKKCLVFAGTSLSFSMFIFSVGNSTLFFIIAQIAWGLSYAFVSGALEAWIVNKLNLTGEELDKLFAKASKYTNISLAFGGLIGAIIYEFDPRYAWVLSTLTALIYLTLVIFYVEDNKDREEITEFGFSDGLSKMKVIIKDSLDFGLKNPIVKYLIFLNFSLCFCLSPIFVYWAPYLKSLTSNGVWILGWVWILIKISTAIGNYLLELLTKHKINRVYTLGIVIILSSACFLFSSKYQFFYIVLILFLIFELLLGILQPLQKSFINDNIVDDKRSTILSFDSMISRSGNFISLFIMGYIGDKLSMGFTWYISGIIILINLFIVIKLKTLTKSKAITTSGLIVE